MLFKLADKSIEAAKWLAIEAPKKTVGGVMSWTRKGISSLFSKAGGPEAMTNAHGKIQDFNAKLDSVLLGPIFDTGAKIVERLGGTPTGVAEKRPGATQLQKASEFFRDAADLSRRGSHRTPFQSSLASEDAALDELETVLAYIDNVPIPTVGPQEQLYTHHIVQGINADRPGAHVSLLSSTHPLTRYAQKEAVYIAQNPSKEKLFRPANTMIYKPLKRGYNDQGQAEFQEQKPVQQRKNIFGHVRYDLGPEDRSRELDAPESNEDGDYHVKLNEKEDSYINRYTERLRSRRNLISVPFTLRVSYGEPGFPINGDPAPLIDRLRTEYKDLFEDTDLGQVALGVYQTGDVVTVVGHLTKDHADLTPPESIQTPEPSDWYSEQAQEGTQSSTATEMLVQRPEFGAASAIAYRALEDFISPLKQEYALDISHDPSPFLERDELTGKRVTTFRFKVNINGTQEELKLLAGSGILLVPQNSLIRSKVPNSDLTQSEYMRVEQYIDCLGKLLAEEKISHRASSHEGYDQEAPPMPVQTPPAPSVKSDE